MKDIFISHCWGNDDLDRDNHLRCKEIADKLIEKGYSVWFDTYDMYGNIDSAIMKAINNCKIVMICLTKKYCEKINNAVLNRLPNDNCYKEWNYSLFKQKVIIPIILEESMIDIFLNGDGIVQMYLNSIMFIDFTKNLDDDFVLLCKNLKYSGVYSSAEKRYYSGSTTNSFNNFVQSLTGMSLKSISPRSIDRLSKRFEKNKKNILKQKTKSKKRNSKNKENITNNLDNKSNQINQIDEINDFNNDFNNVLIHNQISNQSNYSNESNVTNVSNVSNSSSSSFKNKKLVNKVKSLFKLLNLKKVTKNNKIISNKITKKMKKEFFINKNKILSQSANQSVNESVNESANDNSNQSVKDNTNQSANQSENEYVNQSNSLNVPMTISTSVLTSENINNIILGRNNKNSKNNDIVIHL